MITQQDSNPQPTKDEARFGTTASCQLLACDLDGTILEDNHHISERVRRSLFLAGEQGIQITLATGRSFQSTLPYAKLLDIHLPLICYQGGLIQHPDSGETLHADYLSPEVVAEAIKLSQMRDWELLLYTIDEILVTDYRYSEEHYGRLFGPTVRQVKDIGQASSRAMKLLILATESEIPAIAEEMGNRFVGRMEIVRSHSHIVEATPPGVSKGNALAWLAAQLDIPRRAVAAIGDQDNDAPMVAWAGLGVAMGNGSPACKRVADWIAPTIGDDGCAIAIERLLL